MDSKLYQDLTEPDLASARRVARALSAAARMKDDAGWMVNAVRMRRALERANDALGRGYSSREITRASELFALTVKTRTLRETAPVRMSGAKTERILRWANATTSHGSSGAHADLFESDGAEAAFAFSSFARLFLLGVRFQKAQLAGASFDDAVLDGCVLNDAVASATHWNSAQLVSCRFHRCDLADASLGYALFVDCDLREADLSAVRRPDQLGIEGAIFVRCDLRGSKWDGRSLHNVTFTECRMHGVRGRPTLEGVRISSPNLAPEDGGSCIGDAEEVRALWCAVTSESGVNSTALEDSIAYPSSLCGVRQ
jgi:uncharacterized protein YjbI with pentapeptide repeats